VWDWFGRAGQDRYTFSSLLFRFGGLYTGKREDVQFELAAPMLFNLPGGAALPPPLGQLGHGGSYHDANQGQEVNLFLKQAYWRGKNLGARGSRVRVGRFELNDGLEVVPTDPSLAWLKRERVAARLLGNFGFTHVQRSLDGVELVRQTPGLTITGFAGLPTQGVFDLDGMDTLSGVRLGYASVTRPFRSPRRIGDARLFGLHYEDDRSGVVKADNRPLPVRRADTGEVRVETVGAHFVGVWDTSAGKVDGLFWAAGQFGKWGTQTHGAYALAGEVGVQPRGWPGSPWFRAGFNRYSGDGDPADGSHGTFFPVLPTPRPYARFPFYTEANLNDAFLSAQFRPDPRLSVRPEVHFLTLADSHDLWYSGGGAFQAAPSFGYAGRPSGGSHDLATLLDTGIDYQWRKDTAFSLYLGYALGGRVINRIYQGSRGFLGIWSLPDAGSVGQLSHLAGVRKDVIADIRNRSRVVGLRRQDHVVHLPGGDVIQPISFSIVVAAIGV
jgi:hypothetical protein